jgi:hypothetical protein
MMSTIPTHAEAELMIDLDNARLADLLRDVLREHDLLLEKLDVQAGWIAEKMQRLRASIARSRETGPSALSVNGLGELQGQGPELDRLCVEVSAQRDLIDRLHIAFGMKQP